MDHHVRKPAAVFVFPLFSIVTGRKFLKKKTTLRRGITFMHITQRELPVKSIQDMSFSLSLPKNN
jgi:hypothetical protein